MGIILPITVNRLSGKFHSVDNTSSRELRRQVHIRTLRHRLAPGAQDFSRHNSRLQRKRAQLESASPFPRAGGPRFTCKPGKLGSPPGAALLAIRGNRACFQPVQLPHLSSTPTVVAARCRAPGRPTPNTLRRDHLLGKCRLMGGKNPKVVVFRMKSRQPTMDRRA